MNALDLLTDLISALEAGAVETDFGGIQIGRDDAIDVWDALDAAKIAIAAQAAA